MGYHSPWEHAIQPEYESFGRQRGSKTHVSIWTESSFLCSPYEPICAFSVMSSLNCGDLEWWSVTHAPTYQETGGNVDGGPNMESTGPEQSHTLWVYHTNQRAQLQSEGSNRQLSTMHTGHKRNSRREEEQETNRYVGRAGDSDAGRKTQTSFSFHCTL